MAKDLDKLQLYSVEDVMQIAQVSRATISRHQKEGLLTGKKVGRQWRFTEEDIKRYINR